MIQPPVLALLFVELSLLRLLRHCESSKPNLTVTVKSLRGSAPSQRQISGPHGQFLSHLAQLRLDRTTGGASQQKAEVAGSSMFQLWDVCKQKTGRIC